MKTIKQLALLALLVISTSSAFACNCGGGGDTAANDSSYGATDGSSADQSNS